mmetsp:Transcript_27322/g.76756  ORF Transcript_27322/g.76756 Transcript_27322/m.76756 type:complete len:212 (+) Transcript_27322:427-1062(+)
MSEHRPASCWRSTQALQRGKTPPWPLTMSANRRFVAHPAVFAPSGGASPSDCGNQKSPFDAASRWPLVSSFSSLKLTGMTRSHFSSRSTPRSTRMTATIAAFSKSVICTSGVRNSTRQPISPPAGGGLNRTVPQFVPCSCSQWSASCSSSMSIWSSKTMSGSLTRRCATCRLSSSSTPPSRKHSKAGPSMATSTSLAALQASGSLARRQPM